MAVAPPSEAMAQHMTSVTSGRLARRQISACLQNIKSGMELDFVLTQNS